MSSRTAKPRSRSVAPQKESKVTPVRPRDSRALASAEVQKILDSFQLGEVLSHLLRRAHFLAEEMFFQEFAAEAITPRQKATLIMLYQFPGLSQNALSERLFMDRNTVAEMVRRLEASGLIRREPAKTDARAYELFLADPGAEMLNAVMPRDVEVERRLAERVPAELLPSFIKCLRLIVEAPAKSI